MTIIAQLLTSFVASAGFGIVFNAPRRSLWQCGTVGMLGWIVYFLLMEKEIDQLGATVVAAILVGIISQIFARVYKTPVIIFNVAGIIPLVPGGMAYNAMLRFVENNYNIGLQLSAKVMLLSGAIAIGLMFSEVVRKIGINYAKRRLRRQFKMEKKNSN